MASGPLNAGRRLRAVCVGQAVEPGAVSNGSWGAVGACVWQLGAEWMPANTARSHCLRCRFRALGFVLLPEPASTLTPAVAVVDYRATLTSAGVCRHRALLLHRLHVHLLVVRFRTDTCMALLCGCGSRGVASGPHYDAASTAGVAVGRCAHVARWCMRHIHGRVRRGTSRCG